MDAFYASVEQRDAPALRGKPVIVAWRGARSVVCAASYEARKYGVRSAMPAITAERLCPEAVFIPPDFTRYRAVSHQVRSIFGRHTDKVEPLSLDEAYLDVTDSKQGLPTATKIAQQLRREIWQETGLTASAGVAPNKFLAKIASDWRKPNGLFVIQPHEVSDFLAPLSVARLPGVGKATAHELLLLGVSNVRELRALSSASLRNKFGKFGERLYGLARGADDQDVVSDRPTQQVSVEHTLDYDLHLTELAPIVQDTATRAWLAAQRVGRAGRTLVLKLKTADFRLMTRSVTPPDGLQSAAAVAELAVQLLAKIEYSPNERYRLAGVGIANFVEPAADADDDLFRN